MTPRKPQPRKSLPLLESLPLRLFDCVPFHWPHGGKQLLRVRPLPGTTGGDFGYVPSADEGWSSGFPIDTVGSFVVYCEQVRRPWRWAGASRGPQP